MPKKKQIPSLADILMPKKTVKLGKVSDTSARMLKLGTDVLMASTVLSMATIAVGTVARVAERS